MKYLCLVYHEGTELNALPGSEQGALVDEALCYREDLRKSGHYIASETVQPAQMATTIRVRNGQVSIRAGPYAQTKEQLSGFYLIDARDLNDAIRVASKMPPARLGCVEIRPLEEHSRDEKESS